eukprot:98781-Hanusia_phi.AAC.1
MEYVCAQIEKLGLETRGCRGFEASGQHKLKPRSHWPIGAIPGPTVRKLDAGFWARARPGPAQLGHRLAQHTDGAGSLKPVTEE